MGPQRVVHPWRRLFLLGHAHGPCETQASSRPSQTARRTFPHTLSVLSLTHTHTRTHTLFATIHTHTVRCHTHACTTTNKLMTPFGCVLITALVPEVVIQHLDTAPKWRRASVCCRFWRVGSRGWLTICRTFSRSPLMLFLQPLSSSDD